jgi:hypothetical protein
MTAKVGIPSNGTRNRDVTTNEGRRLDDECALIYDQELK